MNKAINPTGPLAALHDIHMPPAVGWWPPAPGWWLLLTLVLIAAIAMLWQRRRLIQRPTPVTAEQIVVAAKQELDQLAKALEAGFSPPQATAELSRLLRRTAIQLTVSRGGKDAVAGLTGEAWLGWLDACWDRDDFHRGAGRMLLDAPYRHAPDIDMPVLLALARSWLEKQS